MTKPSILMVAGEASADAHGSRVLAALSRQYGEVSVFGIGGDACAAQGMEVMVPAKEMALAGLTEVLLALPRMVGILWRLLRAARERRPQVALLLDLPDFNLPLARRLKKLGIPVVYYISPQVWAWRPGRVKQIRRSVDKMLVILPFEETFYRQHRVAAEFVGHPLTEHLPQPQATDGERPCNLGKADQPVIALLPGSRRKEVERHLPTMLQAVAMLRAQGHPNLRAVIAVASTIDKTWLRQLTSQSQTPAVLLSDNSQQALMRCDAAMVCSGTATLEAALLGRPMVIVYRVSCITFLILRWLVSISHIGLVNLIAQKRLVPELLQSEFTAQNLANKTRELLVKGPTRSALMQQLSVLRKKLGHKKPSAAVASALTLFLPAQKKHLEAHHG